MLNGFKKFIMQGNVIDLAVAVVVAGAFGKIIDAFTKGLIEPLIKVVMGGGVSGGQILISGVEGGKDADAPIYLDLSSVINSVITFLITAAVVYFIFVAPMVAFKERRAAKGEPEEPTDNEKIISLLEKIAEKH